MTPAMARALLKLRDARRDYAVYQAGGFKVGHVTHNLTAAVLSAQLQVCDAAEQDNWEYTDAQLNDIADKDKP